MAETLTYDPGTDTVTTEETLTADEQDSLAVGEKIQSEQQQLLAGKYKNAEDLEQAYVELSKKLGSTEESNDETKAESEESTEEPVDEPNPSQTLITDASTEFAEKGELSEDTLSKFSEMSSTDLVNAYMQIQGDLPQQQQQEVDLSDADVNTIKNSVGGDKAYSNVIDWAGKNLDQKTVESFDNLVNTGDTDLIQLAIAGIKAKYDNANGYEGRMLTGKAANTKSDVFRSQQELVSAMSDSRYENDPAYRQDVIDKLERSDN
jgi:hypothetical protein